LFGEARAIRLKRETTSAEVEELLPWAREMAVRSWLKARTEAGLGWGSNSSNSLTASSRPRLPERTRPAMGRSSSKHRSRTRRDMPAGHGTASGPARRRTGGPASASGSCGGSIGGGGAARAAAWSGRGLELERYRRRLRRWLVGAPGRRASGAAGRWPSEAT
jgi:hypothetical protein